MNELEALPEDSLNPVNTQTWANGRHVVRCVKVIQETHDVKTFCFMSQTPIMFFFKPGQFVTLELEIGGEQVMRSYTMSSSPSVPYSFSITVKRVKNGLVSNWLHDNLRVEDEIAVHGPVGNFNCMDFTTDKALFLSGGVGITPVMSMARWWYDTNSAVDMKFVHSAQTPKDIIFKKELELMASRIDNFELSIICERYDTGESWHGYRGFLNQQLLELMAPDVLQREVYCCGPEPYMRAVRAMLTDMGYDMSRYHEESFGETPPEAIEDAEESAELAQIADELPQAGFCVEFIDEGMSVTVTENETVHAASTKLGIHVPKACGMGICGSCKVKLLTGNVNMEHNGGISEEEIEEGYILSCCSKPLDDVSIET
ncbi:MULTISPECIES: hybrid-cluster NAD(P)-dependent oxidoreductase [Grimontia]|uniref:NADH oxidoreductase hcr n=1 Tax=Grimontia marina TaxID=646534 RepID=A0A128F4T0_9GAMM|nr:MULTISPECIES: hybrid-cluster NAD(P)-dependent oxidoreductase [Grimontia]WRV99023.1 hybrid-cluster NAD(P)-dependent oxidoreductase [Grimontia sp. NTOU-MAR1]CZF81286.1 NADH oxidoreductase hcr [Grimontia marina]